jgi:hypothetical protein
MMQTDLKEIIQNLKENRYPNEALISNGVVKRVLSLLGWPIFNPSIVIPEFSLHGRRVDLALCNAPNQPIIFVEVKGLGLCEGADRQLFQYAFEEGIPIAILTDGREWYFYLPGEQGPISERCFYKQDMFQRELADVEFVFQRYLSYEAVINGTAFENARLDYRDLSRNRTIARVFPKAWRELVEKRDEFLYEAVSSKIEALCGYKPSVQFVQRLLVEELLLKNSEPSPLPKTTEKRAKEAVIRKKIPKKYKFTYNFFGETRKCETGRDLARQIFIAFHQRDVRFFEKFLEYPKGYHSRPYISKSREGLYPGAPKLSSAGVELIDGWWLDGNQSISGLLRLIQIACDVENVKYGQDLIIEKAVA